MCPLNYSLNSVSSQSPSILDGVSHLPGEPTTFRATSPSISPLACYYFISVEWLASDKFVSSLGCWLQVWSQPITCLYMTHFELLVLFIWLDGSILSTPPVCHFQPLIYSLVWTTDVDLLTFMSSIFSLHLWLHFVLFLFSIQFFALHCWIWVLKTLFFSTTGTDFGFFLVTHYPFFWTEDLISFSVGLTKQILDYCANLHNSNQSYGFKIYISHLV